MAGPDWPNSTGMAFRVLGPVEIWNEDRCFPVGTIKEQGVLAILLLDVGRVVPVQRLAERLWDEQMPDSARETIQAYVSRLRRRLREAGDENGLITRAPAGGYRLTGPREQVDSVRFQALLDAARAEAGRRNLEQAVGLLRQAEKLWSGEPLSGLPGPWARETRERLIGKLRAARLVRIDLELQLGIGPDDLIGELGQMVWSGPVDQGAAEQLMRALHDAGRQSEALEVFRRMRRRMREELGSEPRPQLISLHQQMLRGQPLGRSMGADPRRPKLSADTLDRDIVHLTGREQMIEELVGALRTDQAAGAGVACYEVDGMAGVGKTALVVHVAHRLRDQFPDGLLQANLRAHDPREPELDVRQALVQLLEAMGVEGREIGRAESVDALAALWRLRTSGLRVLVLLDDVPSFEDIRALIPSAAGSAVLVTSRRRLLTPVAARQYTLAPLTEAATIELLERLTGRRLGRESALARQVARYCGGLPLAIVVASAYLSARPGWGLEDLLERFKAATPPRIDDPLVGPVNVALSISYRELPEPVRTLLRRIAALPGADAGVHAIAAMVAEPFGRTLIDLDLLTENHLAVEHAPRRYRLHDAVRSFALAQIEHEEDAAAAERAIDRATEFYVAVTARAEYTLRPHRRAAQRTLAATAHHPEPAFPDRAAAQDWLDRETDNLIALAAHSRAMAPTHARDLAALLAKHLDRRNGWQQAKNLLTHALTTSPLSDLEQADLRVDLASAQIRTGEFEDAGRLARDALGTYVACGDQHGQANALYALGRIDWLGQRLGESDGALSRAARHYEAVGDTRGANNAHLLRASVQFERGCFGDALEAAGGAVSAARQLGDPALLCDALANLGEIHRRLDQDEKAHEYIAEALPLARTLGDPYTIAVLEHNTAEIHLAASRPEAALTGFQAALRTFRMHEDDYSQASSLIGLAEAYCLLKTLPEAEASLARAAELVDGQLDPHLHAHLALGRGHLAAAQGRLELAATHLQNASSHAARSGALLEQMRVELALAELEQAAGRPETAHGHTARAEQFAATLHAQASSSS